MVIAACIAVFGPLFGATLVGLLARRLSAMWASVLIMIPMLCAAGAGAIVCYHTCWMEQTFYVPLAPFLKLWSLKLEWGLYLDALSGMMVGVVTLVSCLVHLYSVGYMHGEEGVPRFMAYLSLFTFFMLMLVTAGQFVQLFLGWEGVGLASYLLIGFYYKKASACDAAMKAFLVNRVGDVGYVLGMALVLWGFGSLAFGDVLSAATSMQSHLFYIPFVGTVPLTEAVAFLFFVAAMGKSAQIGLHVWLPDAMEGPTPVSALIHAATMVTAGVFLMARLSPLLEYAPHVKTLILIVGGLTAFMAATIGCVQMDIKRVIAYSTCSQLGYMFMGIGVGAYDAAVFHLMTHAFFKALLFLSAGAVIHSFSGVQDMQQMGGVWRKLPFTYAVMWIGSLALAGLPLFAGFYSKDAILMALGGGAGKAAHFGFMMGLVGVILTAFYSWRLLILTFHGNLRAPSLVAAHIHESPWVMRVPLIILAAGAIFAGYGAEELFLGKASMWGDALVAHQLGHAPLWKELLPTFLSVSGIALALYLYVRVPHLPGRMAERFGALHGFLRNRWYIDALYGAVFVRGIVGLSAWLWRIWDTKIIDGGGVHGLTRMTTRLGSWVVLTQTGYLQHYVAWICVGLLLLLVCSLEEVRWLLG